MASCLNSKKEHIFDLAIITNDGTVSYFHKAYIAMNFDKYRTLFTCEFGDKNPDTITVAISRQELELVAYFCLYGKFNPPHNPSSYEHIHNILVFADENQCIALKRDCEAYIMTNIKGIVEGDTRTVDKLVYHRNILNDKTLLAIQHEVEKHLTKYRTHITTYIDIDTALYYIANWEATLIILEDYISAKGNTQQAVDEAVRALGSWNLREIDKKENCRRMHNIVVRCSNLVDYKLIASMIVESLLTCKS